MQALQTPAAAPAVLATALLMSGECCPICNSLKAGTFYVRLPSVPTLLTECNGVLLQGRLTLTGRSSLIAKLGSSGSSGSGSSGGGLNSTGSGSNSSSPAGAPSRRHLLKASSPDRAVLMRMPMYMPTLEGHEHVGQASIRMADGSMMSAVDSSGFFGPTGHNRKLLQTSASSTTATGFVSSLIVSVSTRQQEAAALAQYLAGVTITTVECNGLSNAMIIV